MARLHLTVVPGGRQEKIERTNEGLRVHVAAPATQGKANKKLLLLLAHRLQIPVSRITLTQGVASRYKVVEVPGLTVEQVESRLLR